MCLDVVVAYPRGGVTSVNYGLGLRATLMQILVHSCTQQGICRSAEFQKLDDWGVRLPVVPLRSTPNLEGIEPLDFSYRDGQVPDIDRIHCRSRLLKLLANSPEIQKQIASGSLLLGESYYDEKSGRVFWLSFWRSSNPANQVPSGFIRAIVDGAITKESHLEELHPALRSLNALVLGNKAFAHQFEPPVPTEVVMFGCADSRASSIILKAPFGLVEWVRNAGNVFDDPMLPGIRHSLESAERDLRLGFEAHGTRFADPEGYKRRAALVVLSHTACGAIQAALSDHDPAGHSAHGDVAPLVNPIRRRLVTYLTDHPAPAVTDPHLASAAQANAIAACFDLMTIDHPEARRIREMVGDDRVIVVPARYSIRRGLLQMFKPLTKDYLHHLGSIS